MQLSLNIIRLIILIKIFHSYNGIILMNIKHNYIY